MIVDQNELGREVSQPRTNSRTARNKKKSKENPAMR